MLVHVERCGPFGREARIFFAMKFAILVLLTFFFWQSPGARRSAAIALQQTAKFVQPEPTNLQERFDRLNSEFSNCLTLE